MTEPYRCIASLTDRSPMCKRQTSGLRIPMRCIEKKTKTLEQEHKKPVVKRRDADGVWETVRSWFGKKYYEVTYETVKKQIHIDVGTNMEDYMERLEPVVTKAVTEFVSDALLQIEKAYFAPQEQYANKMETAIDQLQKRLENVKFREN